MRSQSPIRRGWLSRRGHLREETVLPLVVLVVLLLVWEVVTAVGWLNPFFFSSPIRVLASGAGDVTEFDFWSDLAISTVEFGSGYILAIAVAIPFGLLTGWHTRLHYLFEPWLNGFNSLPRLALLPLIVLWVGLGIWSKIVVVFLGAFFPIAINAFHGVRTVDRNLVAVAESFGASRRRLFTTVVLPSTVPFISTGARVGVGRAMAGVIVGEFYTAEAGIAHRAFKAGHTLQIDQMLFAALVITIIALLAFRAVRALERRFTHWRPTAVREQS